MRSVVFECTASGTPSLQLSWFKGDMNLTIDIHPLIMLLMRTIQTMSVGLRVHLPFTAQLTKTAVLISAWQLS